MHALILQMTDLSPCIGRIKRNKQSLVIAEIPKSKESTVSKDSKDKGE